MSIPAEPSLFRYEVQVFNAEPTLAKLQVIIQCIQTDNNYHLLASVNVHFELYQTLQEITICKFCTFCHLVLFQTLFS